MHIYLPTYSVGKERVYLHVARELNISLYVDSGKRRVLGYVEAKPCGTWPASAAREAAGHAELDLAPKEASGGSTTAEAPYFRHRCSIASAYLQRTSRASPPTPPPPVGVSSPWLRCGSTARALLQQCGGKVCDARLKPRTSRPQAGLLLTRASLASDSTTRASRFGRLAGALDGAAPGDTAT